MVRNFKNVTQSAIKNVLFLILEIQLKNTFFHVISEHWCKRVPFGFRSEPDSIFPGLHHMFHSHFHILH